MGEPVEQRGGHFGIAEHLGPFAEAVAAVDKVPAVHVAYDCLVDFAGSEVNEARSL